MRDFEEKSYYEIQLDNKQLILVFLAGVTVCVLVFILGVMVGKGKKEAEMVSLRNESVATKPSADLTQPDDVQALKDNKDTTEETKDKGTARKNKKDKPAADEPKAPVVVKSEEPAYAGLDQNDKETPLTPDPKPVKTAPPPKNPEEKLSDVAVKTQEPVADTAPTNSVKGTKYTVQVMATGSKDKAEQQLNYLKQKGYTAFMNEEKTGSGASVFKVRVGKFADSDSAKKVATNLKQELKLETWVAVLE